MSEYQTMRGLCGKLLCGLGFGLMGLGVLIAIPLFIDTEVSDRQREAMVNKLFSRLLELGVKDPRIDQVIALKSEAKGLYDSIPNGGIIYRSRHKLDGKPDYSGDFKESQALYGKARSLTEEVLRDVGPKIADYRFETDFNTLQKQDKAGNIRWAIFLSLLLLGLACLLTLKILARLGYVIDCF